MAWKNFNNYVRTLDLSIVVPAWICPTYQDWRQPGACVMSVEVFLWLFFYSLSSHKHNLLLHIAHHPWPRSCSVYSLAWHQQEGESEEFPVKKDYKYTKWEQGIETFYLYCSVSRLLIVINFAPPPPPPLSIQSDIRTLYYHSINVLCTPLDEDT